MNCLAVTDLSHHMAFSHYMYVVDMTKYLTVVTEEQHRMLGNWTG